MSIDMVKNILWSIIWQKTPEKVNVSSLEVIEKKSPVTGCAKLGRFVMEKQIEIQRAKVIVTNF